MIIKHLNNYIITLCLILYSININANATESLKRYEISILSIGEGSSLADAFGHTGIRVRDSVLQNDIVFNYGIYDFNAPNFYSNFVKGRPEYKLGIQNYKNFVQGYFKENRYIIEHQLDFDKNSTLKIIELLIDLNLQRFFNSHIGISHSSAITSSRKHQGTNHRQAAGIAQ